MLENYARRFIPLPAVVWQGLVTFSGQGAVLANGTVPGQSAWPDATNTGVPVGTTLTPWSNSNTITTSQTITAKHFTGGVDVLGNITVTFNNCLFDGFTDGSGQGLTIESGNVAVNNCMFNGPGPNATSEYYAVGINAYGSGGNIGNITIQSCRFRYWVGAIQFTGDNWGTGTQVLIQDSYIGPCSVGGHTDGIWWQGTMSTNRKIVVNHNTIYNQQTQSDCILFGVAYTFSPNTTAPNDGGIITNNLMVSGTGNFCLDAAGAGPPDYTPTAYPTNVTVTGNHFGADSNGLAFPQSDSFGWDVNNPGNVCSPNYYDGRTIFATLVAD